jgi:hypothetical protein
MDAGDAMRAFVLNRGLRLAGAECAGVQTLHPCPHIAPASDRVQLEGFGEWIFRLRSFVSGNI